MRRAVQRGEASWRMLGGLSACLAVAGLGLALVFSLADLDLEQDGLLLWAWVALASTGTGVWGAAVGKRMPSRELGIAVLVVLELAALWAVAAGTATSLT